MRRIPSVIAVLAVLGCGGGPSGPRFPAPAGPYNVTPGGASTPEEAKFFTGVSKFYLGTQKDQDGVKTKNCDEIKSAEQLWHDAEVEIYGGSSISPQAAARLLQNIHKYLPVFAQQEKVVCKTRGKQAG